MLQIGNHSVHIHYQIS